MEFDTDVLIVGAGPTGLMLACQLVRFGISFRIIDKEADLAKESRAIGIQAKSMEIFQNLGIVNEFLARSNSPKEGLLYFNSKLKFTLNFKDIQIPGTPFSKVYALPQSETELILIDHLKKAQVYVEHQTELVSFIQNTDGIEADIKNTALNKNEKIQCRYLVGCDGAKSRVREVLNIPFEGGSYYQDFVLVDATIKNSFPKENFALFVNKKGILVHIPLQEKYSRLIIAGIKKDPNAEDRPPSVDDIEEFAKQKIGISLELENPRWISRFHLHHRAVQHYQKERSFLAGDAAHIHSPVAGQGMNTGLQDATNLAWKLASVIKYHAPRELLETYQTERLRIGKILLKSTDRIFGLMTSKNPFIVFLRQYVLPNIISLFKGCKSTQKKIFCFMSELAIHYHINPFVMEYCQGADKLFLEGPNAGSRAPDDQAGNSTLFEKFRLKPWNILIFQIDDKLSNSQEKILSEISKICPEIIGIHQFTSGNEHTTLFERYGVNSSAIYLIRPDGYIGFRAFGYNFDALQKYLIKLYGTS